MTQHNQQSSSSEDLAQAFPPLPPEIRKHQDWQILGETFEAMGKAGLALTVGFSVAAAFCKMMDSGKLQLPDFISLLSQPERTDAKPKTPPDNT